MNDGLKEDNKYTLLSRIQGALRILSILLLVAVVLIEGYYIFVLSDKISKQRDETKDILIQLQFLENERNDLYEKLSSVKKIAGEK